LNLLPNGPLRKPLRMAMAELEKQRSLEMQRGFDREMRIEQAIQEAAGLDGFPGIKAVLQMIRETMPQGAFDHLPTDPGELRRQVIEQLVYSTPNIFVEMAPPSYAHQEPLKLWKIWDFDQILQNAVALTRYVSSAQENVVSVEIPGDLVNLTGPVAVAFERYLVFLGTFAGAESKAPCPRCSQGPPTECDECGGLGWVIKPQLGGSDGR
jgi:hypothetical protein